MRTLGSLSHKIVRHHWLIHQLDIILPLVIIVLASGYPFLPSHSKGELWNGAFVVLNAQVRIDNMLKSLPQNQKRVEKDQASTRK